MKRGNITPNGVNLKPHEYSTILFFTNLGKDVELIPPEKASNVKSADMIMDGVVWEMKSPCGKGKYLIRDTLRNASSQSANIIIDLRRTKLHPTKCLREIEKYFNHYREIRQLLVITKESSLLTYRK